MRSIEGSSVEITDAYICTRRDREGLNVCARKTVDIAGEVRGGHVGHRVVAWGDTYKVVLSLIGLYQWSER